ncbi:MAG: hypothetical protein IJ074_05345 [Clostridia bacterium]|nr:hypothetical protein [Clostridia bacterium]
MKKSRISFGPGAASLILIVVVLSMSVLGILALMNAHNDSKLSKRSIEVIQAGYELGENAERTLARLDEIALLCAKSTDTDETYIEMLKTNLPAGMWLDEREIRWTETDGARTLECAVEAMPLGAAQRFEWRLYSLTAITEEVWN